MASKMMSLQTAEKRFLNKLYKDDYGHSAVVEWPDNYPATGDRRYFEIKCKKCGVRISGGWRSFQNADGSIPSSQVTIYNTHIHQHRPKETIHLDPYIVMSVEMRRGSDTEFWVALVNDNDFLEAIGDTWRPHGAWADSYPYAAWRKDSRGKWHYMGTYATEMEAVGKITENQRNYELKGYRATVHTRNDDVGVIPPAATVKLSVRALIDEYKKLRSGATPMEVNEWLGKVNDALTQVSLLETLREEVEERFQKSLEI